MGVSPDTCFILALSKREIHSEVCESFLKDLREVSCDIILLKTVEEEYFGVLNRNMNILKDILRKTTRDFSKLNRSKRTYENFKKYSEKMYSIIEKK